MAVQADERMRDLEVEVGALGLDQVAEGVVEIECHIATFIGPDVARL